MEFKILEAEKDNLKFIIEEDFPEVGVYLYIFKDGKCIKDYLQNNIEICKAQAFEEYGVSLSEWSKKSSQA